MTFEEVEPDQFSLGLFFWVIESAVFFDVSSDLVAISINRGFIVIGSDLIDDLELSLAWQFSDWCFFESVELLLGNLFVRFGGVFGNNFWCYFAAVFRSSEGVTVLFLDVISVLNEVREGLWAEEAFNSDIAVVGLSNWGEVGHVDVMFEVWIKGWVPWCLNC